MKKMYVAPASEVAELRCSGILCGSQSDQVCRDSYGGPIELTD